MSTVGYGVADRQLTGRERWMSFWCLFFFGFSTVYALFKCGPVLVDIGRSFGMSLASVGYVNSVFAIAAVVFAYPGAFIIRRFGVKFSLLITALVSLLGTLVGLGASSAGTLIFGRFLEGAGFGLIAVIGPNVMLRLFPQERLGLVMGVWSLWVPVGTIIAFFTGPGLYGSWGFRGLWWVSVALGIVTILWLLASFRLSAVAENTISGGDVRKARRLNRRDYIGGAMLIMIAFTFWAFVYAGVINQFYPSYLQEQKGFSIFSSAMVVNLTALITIPAGIAFGLISDRTHTRKWFVAVPFAVLALMLFTFAFSPGRGTTAPWIFAIVLGLCAGGLPMGTRSIVPILVSDTTKVDYVLATMAFTTGIGLLGPGLYGSVAASLGFRGASFALLGPCSALACILVLLAKSDRRVMEENAEQPELHQATPAAGASANAMGAGPALDPASRPSGTTRPRPIHGHFWAQRHPAQRGKEIGRTRISTSWRAAG
nr:MFS transporter [uncultured Holophaga sp.]